MFKGSKPFAFKIKVFEKLTLLLSSVLGTFMLGFMRIIDTL